MEMVDNSLEIEANFEKDLAALLNTYSKENESNTPDFLLARFVRWSLNAFNQAVRTRAEWYKKEEMADVSLFESWQALRRFIEELKEQHIDSKNYWVICEILSEMDRLTVIREQEKEESICLPEPEVTTKPAVIIRKVTREPFVIEPDEEDSDDPDQS